MAKQGTQEAVVVVIDDEESMREGSRQVLEDAGYSAYAVGDGARGVVLTKEVKPNVVLLDLKMPGMDGMEVLAELRGIEPAPVPVVITGYGTIDSSVKTMQMGAYDYLCKPFDDQALLATVERAVEKSRLERKLAAAERETRAAVHAFAAEVAERIERPVTEALDWLDNLSGAFAGPLTAKQKWALERARERLAGLRGLAAEWRKRGGSD